MRAFGLDEARAIARAAHAGQVDKLGVDYMQHVEAVAAGLADFDLDVQIAGMLHDTVEDCVASPSRVCVPRVYPSVPFLSSNWSPATSIRTCPTRRAFVW